MSQPGIALRWIVLATLMGSTPAALAQDRARVSEPPTINLRRTVTVDVVRRTKDAVVNVSTTKMVARRISPFGDDPFFRQFDFGNVVRVPANSLGSGFIVHPDGYVVTNNHVIDRARQITVELSDGRKLEAELISSDTEADLAILKVSADAPLPYLQLGDSSELLIGEPVIAVGNPFGYSHSVSTGIVSAIHRNIRTDDKVLLPDLIQTDAAINPGNSGGPLLNAYGQVIGINTAIRGDAQNIGFAIQVNKLRDLIPELLNPAQAAKLDLPVKLAEKRRIVEPASVVAEVQWINDDNSRVAVQSINGHKPRDIIDAYAIILKTEPGATLTFELAGGAKRTFTAKTLAPPQAIMLAKKRLGIACQELTPMLAQKLGLQDDHGILITEIARGSVADRAGLKPGDVIIQLGMYPVQTLNDFGILLQHLPADGRVPVRIRRGDQTGAGVLVFGGESI